MGNEKKVYNKEIFINFIALFLGFGIVEYYTK